MESVILLLPIALLLWLILRGRKQQRAVADLQSSIQPGQRVMTSSGLYATVLEVSDTTIELEIAPGVRTTWVRAAIARKVEDAPAAEGTPDVATGSAPGSPTGTTTTPRTADGAADPLTEAPERPER